MQGACGRVHLMGRRVHEEVRSLRQSEGRMEGNEGRGMDTRGQVSQNPQTTVGPLVLTLRVWEPLEVGADEWHGQMVPALAGSP